jgi:2-keto-3-deoxy-L-rhamnonate aldolase RhmA
MQCFTGDRAMIEVLGLTGFDFVMLDTEHSPANPRAIEDAVLAADIVGLVPLVRIPSCADETAIRRAMEAGAQGLFVPEVKSADDVRRVLDAALFPPLGSRGICPATRAARYSYRSFVDYAEWNNRNFLVVPLIENPDAVDNIDEICALDQVHVLAFGPGDLAYAIGEGNNMTDSPKIREAYLKVQAAADRHGVAVMGGPVLDPSVDAVNPRWKTASRCSASAWMSWDSGGSASTPSVSPATRCKAPPTPGPKPRPRTSHRISLREKPTPRLRGTAQ